MAATCKERDEAQRGRGECGPLNEGRTQFSSVAQSCPTLCNPMDCSMSGFPAAAAAAKSLQSCLTLCDPIDGSSPSPIPRVYSNSCPLSRWSHPTISSSVIPFSSRLQSFPASGSFPVSQFFTSGGQSIGVSASASVLPMNIQDWCPLGWTVWISLQSLGSLKSLLQHHSSKASEPTYKGSNWRA